jgi:hypothetical protein
MEESERLKKAILEVINTQVRTNEPPETAQTLARLQSQGLSEEEALKLIGYVVATEVFAVLKEGRKYDEEKYIRALQALPKLPWD